MDHAQTLVVRNMSMTFGGQRALDAVDVSIRRGEIHGLVGQNGCGKSTLIKILSGYHHPDPGGELEIDGRPVKLPVRTGSASELGMSFVHQDLGLLPTLTVVENFRAWTISTGQKSVVVGCPLELVLLDRAQHEHRIVPGGFPQTVNVDTEV